MGISTWFKDRKKQVEETVQGANESLKTGWNAVVEQSGVIIDNVKQSVSPEKIEEAYKNTNSYIQEFRRDPQKKLKEAGENFLAGLNGTKNRTEQSNFPTNIKDPIIFAVYDIGHSSAPPGHVAMYYRGKVIDAIPKDKDVLPIIAGKTMKASVGKDLKEENSSSFFEFSTSSKAQIFVVDPKQFNITTEADKANFEKRISEIIKEKEWNLQNKNCVQQVLKGLGNNFSASLIPLKEGRLKSTLMSQTLNYLHTDIPLLFGRQLSQMTDEGKCVRISHQALRNYEKECYNKRNPSKQKSNIAENNSQQQKDFATLLKEMIARRQKNNK